jgi:hypothetical protein
LVVPQINRALARDSHASAPMEFSVNKHRSNALENSNLDMTDL